MRTTDNDFWLCNYMVLCQIRHSKFFPPGESCVAGSVSVDLLGSYLWCWQMLWSCTCLAWTKPAQTQLGEKCTPLWLYSHVMLVFQRQTKLPSPQSWGCWCAGPGVGLGLKVLIQEILRFWESSMLQFWCLQFLLPHVSQEDWAARGRLSSEWWIFSWLCWKFRDGDDPSAEPEHIQPCCGQRGGGSLFDNFENHPRSFLCFHQCSAKPSVKPLKNTSSKECLMVSKPSFFFVQAKMTQQVCPELTNVSSCPQNPILWQITSLPINKYSFTGLWWKRCRMVRGPGKSGTLEGKELWV